jgi:Fe2+ transport system protein FeoA
MSSLEHADLGVAAEVPLTSLRAGQTAVIARLQMDADDSKLLCAMGLCHRATIRLVRLGRPCVVAVGGVDTHRCKCGGRCRIGLAWDLANRVMVRPSAASEG